MEQAGGAELSLLELWALIHGGQNRWPDVLSCRGMDTTGDSCAPSSSALLSVAPTRLFGS